MKAKSAPWIDTELKSLMSKRDEAKKAAVLSGSTVDRKLYCTPRNHVTKMNRGKQRKYYQKRISDSGKDGKKIWNVLNEIMGKKIHLLFFCRLEWSLFDEANTDCKLF